MLHLGQAQAPTRTRPASASPTHAGASAPRPSGQIYGTLINLSGRRRFTSQRVVLYAVLAQQGHDGAMALSRGALATFLEAHDTLVKGNGTVPGLFCDELKDVYLGAPGGEKTIRAFIDLARRTQDSVDARSPGAPVLLDELVASATPLLAVLNQITLVYENLATTQASSSRQQLSGVLTDIESIAKHARIVAFNAQVAAARAGGAGREFAVVAGELSAITSKIDELVHQAMRASAA